MSYEECVRRITKLLHAVEEEEEMLGVENSGSEDELEICDYESGTEQSGDESEDGVSEDELPLYVRLCTIVGKMVQLSGKLFNHHKIRELSFNLGINSSNMLEYYEYKRIGINTCEKLLIYRKKWFLFHGVMKYPTPPHKDNA